MLGFSACCVEVEYEKLSWEYPTWSSANKTADGLDTETVSSLSLAAMNGSVMS